MITSCNPGSWLECVGVFELVGEAEQFTLDTDSQTIVELSLLLRTFREDPDQSYVGRLKITIEPA